MDRGKLLAVCFVWLVILIVAAATWKLFLAPEREKARESAEKQAEAERLAKTSAEGRYKHSVRFALDSFSGYAVLRSPEFQSELAERQIKLELVDDGANYAERMRGLASGDVPMGVITIDALIKGSAQVGDLPATIVAIVDETRGADAMVAYAKAVPNVDALDDPATRFVLTPDSPSETLARVVMAHFSLARVAPDPFVKAKDAADVFDRYRKAKPDTREVFVLWEPYVSKVLENPATHRVIDSSRFRGYIVDAIVANRDYLVKNQETVAAVVESYLRALYAHREKMADLVREDAGKSGEPLTREQAEGLVAGVWWKNTQENYAHFGLRQGQSLQHVEDMIANITGVLVRTKAIGRDPTGGRPNLLYYDKVLRRLDDAAFHPGLDVEKIRDDAVKLPTLTEAQWEKLVPVGTLEVPPLVFARGTSQLTEPSRKVLDDVIQTLKNWPQYYVLVRGHAATEGDPEANKALAEARAKAAEQYLAEGGIDPVRIRAVGVAPSGRTSVTFVLGQPPY